MQPQPALPQPGDRIGGHIIEAPLGQGGMGAVYRVRHEETGVARALKVIRADLLADDLEFALARFRREVESMAKVSHPGIVKIHACGVDAGRPWAAMELVVGKPLSAWTQRQPIPPRRAAKTAADLARALEHAHAAGVIHRDLKPENVLIDGGGQARLTDFGLAYDLHATKLSRTGEVLGTPQFMAPEQVSPEAFARAGADAFGPATDIWGLGGVLYAALTGSPPFPGDDAQSVMLDVIGAPLVPPKERNAGVPEALDRICRKALEKDPADRYGSAAEMADDLDRWLRGESVRARPVGRIQQLERRRRPQMIAALAVGAVLAVVSAIVILLNMPVPTLTAKDRRRIEESLIASSLAAADRERVVQIIADERHPSYAWAVLVVELEELDDEDDVELARLRGHLDRARHDPPLESELRSLVERLLIARDRTELLAWLAQADGAPVELVATIEHFTARPKRFAAAPGGGFKDLREKLLDRAFAKGAPPGAAKAAAELAAETEGDFRKEVVVWMQRLSLDRIPDASGWSPRLRAEVLRHLAAVLKRRRQGDVERFSLITGALAFTSATEAEVELAVALNEAVFDTVLDSDVLGGALSDEDLEALMQAALVLYQFRSLHFTGSDFLAEAVASVDFAWIEARVAAERAKPRELQHPGVLVALAYLAIFPAQWREDRAKRVATTVELVDEARALVAEIAPADRPVPAWVHLASAELLLWAARLEATRDRRPWDTPPGDAVVRVRPDALEHARSASAQAIGYDRAASRIAVEILLHEQSAAPATEAGRLLREAAERILDLAESRLEWCEREKPDSADRARVIRAALDLLERLTERLLAVGPPACDGEPHGIDGLDDAAGRLLDAMPDEDRARRDLHRARILEATARHDRRHTRLEEALARLERAEDIARTLRRASIKQDEVTALLLANLEGQRAVLVELGRDEEAKALKDRIEAERR